MKTRVALAALFGVLLVGCNNKEEELQKQLGLSERERSSLQQNISTRDSYIEEVMRSVNDVYTDLEKARVKEGQIAERAEGVEGSSKFTNTDTRRTLLQNISDIGSALKENRKKIEDLQSRVKTDRGRIASLSTLVDNLKRSLQEREHSIALLEARVQGLEDTVTAKTKTIAEKEGLIDEQQRKINTAYYVVGTRDELKKKGIITDEGGFLWGLLGSTTVMAAGFDPSEFTPLDKTKDQLIPVQGKIEEILPRRSPDFFATAQQDGHHSELTIVSPDRFWRDEYLVIVVD